MEYHSLTSKSQTLARKRVDYELSVLAEKYGFKVEFIDYENTRQDSHSTIVPVASFDIVEQFVAA